MYDDYSRSEMYDDYSGSEMYVDSGSEMYDDSGYAEGGQLGSGSGWLFGEDRAGKYNNCKDKTNGDSCMKRCKGASCDNAKCWEKTCLTARKYQIVSSAGKKQRRVASTEYNICTGKKDGDACTKRCQSDTCKKAKCFKTVCLTGKKYCEAGGKC
eukprot:GFUD01006050.1.p1 GENE.GFUD01006050.1~~GFUD01006050.1.p1  ORF type:complete len:155 (+),score=46.48 GFUD01006050.1:130-594(+)